MPLTGQTKSISGTPDELGHLRRQIAGFLTRQKTVDQTNGMGLSRMFTPAVDTGDVRNAFAGRRGIALAAAKESAGNLTGSGMGYYLGQAAGQSALEENSTIAQMEQARREGNSQRFLNLLLGFSTSGVGPPQAAYQPGLLDSAIQGAGAAAPFFMKSAGVGAKK